jgi:tetratricopeptide (TPR) repeat protein
MIARPYIKDLNARPATTGRTDRIINQGWRALVAAGAVAFLPLPAAAQRNAAVEADHYARCMIDARKSPAVAADSASAWRAAGGGHPAEHCNAVALIGLGRYEEASKRLDALADAMTAPADLRAQILDQAGQAWLLAGKPARAESDLTLALALAPDDPDLLTDRAEAFAGGKRYPEAVADLDRALTIDPGRADALVFRAAAHRALGRLPAALQDVEAALRLAPNQPDALLERGNIRIMQNDEAGARADWRQVAIAAPRSPAEKVAMQNLAKLDAPPVTAPQQKAAPPKR